MSRWPALPHPSRRLLLTAAAGLLLLLAIGLGAARWAAGQAQSVTDASAMQLARSNGGLIESELQKFRLLPLVLTEYPDVRAMLERSDPAAAGRINAKLELLADRTDAAAIYVIDADGRTVAASNHRLTTSFVGQNYGFRPYFQGALRDGAAELFALGTVSGRPGLYIARRIGTPERPLGVVVVKIEFDAIQAGWARQDGATLVTDRHGVVIIASQPQWRFGTLAPLDARARAAIRTTRQYGDLPLAMLALERRGDGVLLPGGTEAYRQASVPVPLDGGRLHVFFPLRPAQASANASARLVTLGAMAAIVVVLALAWRARERRTMQEAVRRTLEHEVAARTAELSDANARLIEESAERARADERYREAREELAQASRLGSIGQITAGVAHEINQPVAAIRTFAENARQFLSRGEGDQADANLDRIVHLTQRIGAITGELRSFARRRAPQMGAVRVRDAIDSALLLIGHRLRSQGVSLDRVGPALDAQVLADRVRLEQIVINLLQNALDATGGMAAPRIRVEATASDETVAIEIADNGPGVAPELVDQIFNPFVTGHEHGLGLGLPIARTIAREFGGELSLVASPLGGAAFRIELKPA